ncbi:ATP-binding cassette sub-family C member 2-like isoform X2 [Dermacentor silvarum]|uniref:ATP-binding cassette sub-family C member 2-like isoform X2 n=1 Tax=Dermacentor silvarum TaxID=543639 RepID=UPI002100E23D|nr:ATP-binding cassette sub-family C member 2-like isoform X2 [Dermacentor silvarum]
MADVLWPAEVASFLLKCSTLVILVLFGGSQTLPNNFPAVPKGPYWTLLDVAQLVLLMVSTGLAIAKGSVMLESVDLLGYQSVPDLRRATSDFAMALSIALLTLMLWRRWRRCLPPSGFAAAILGLLSTACVLDAFRLCAATTQLQDITLSANQLEKRSFIVSFIVLATVLGNFVLSEIQDLVIKNPKCHLESFDEDTMSLLGRQACTVLCPLFKDARSTGASASARLPVLRRGLRCKNLVQILTAKLAAKRILPGHRSTFVIVLAKVLWMDALRIFLVTATYYGCIYSRIPALELLINSRDQVSMMSAVLLFAAATTFELLISCYQMDILHTFGVRIRSMLQGIIFKKVTTMSAGSKARYPTGHISSLLGVDCSLLSSCAFAIPVPLFGVLLYPLLFWMLAERAGLVPSLCTAAWALLVLGLPFFGSFLQKFFWKKAIRARDERLKATSDLLSTIRVVKMYAWEDALQENVHRSREVELKWLLRVNLLDAILDCIYNSTSSVLMIILFSTLYVLKPDMVLTPALSFSCVSLLYMTDLSMNGCGQALRNFSQGSLALKRIADFCTAEEQENVNSSSYLPTRKGTVTMQRCSFSWGKLDDDQTEAHLNDITLNVEPGSLIGIVGFVGSGKSSLLAAILGDMHRIKGKITCTGRVAFAPQLPNVHNMTIRDNILYGKPMDPVFYEQVIRSCQLMNDINKLPSGDMTEVGEKGTNLSGGQKQRISLARAVYSQSDIYLLDDPLSALDPVVGSRVFREVIGNRGMLSNKTRIMVCNQGHYLHNMDKLVLVDGKRIRVYDQLEDLVTDPESPRNFREALEQRRSRDQSKTGSANEEMEENDTVGRITQEELGSSSKTGWQLLRILLRLAQWPALVGVLVFLAAACAFAFEQIWIKEWTDASSRAATGSTFEQLPWVQVLVSLCIIDVALRIVGSVLLSLSAKRLSRSLHKEMLDHVLRSPVSFFDASPRGRILNRFSADIDFIDSRTFLSGKQSVQNTLITVAKIAVIGTQSPIVLGVTAVATVLAGYGMNLAVKASHCARFSESVAVSRMLQHVTETVDALSSVRTYGVADRFRRHFCRLTDETMRGYSSFGTAYRFTRTLTSTSGFVVVVCTLLANTVFAGPDGPDPSSLGLALSSATSVPLALMTLCVMLFNVLQMIVSFERCVEYTELPPEDDLPPTWGEEQRAAVDKILLSWPSEGKVEFQSYSASYRPGLLPNVLNGVTLVVNPKEKVGVVGRTGAGKSSLVLALLRMLRASEGRILIDSVDVAGVPLRKLRRSITVIPQDPSLVRGTLRMNLDPTNSHSDREIWQCLERAHLAKVVSGDPKGLLLETADGGSNLSVGQRQLVCLARALLRGTKILLLDEATSQMDGDTDQLIQVALRDAFAQCTLFTIAHRLHTVLDYDRILVLEDGKVREFDTVPRLLSDKSSVFYSMAIEAGINSARRRPELISTTL